MILGTRKLTVCPSASTKSCCFHTDISTAINRLDRLTSGLMIIPLSAARASSVSKEFIQGTIRKEYIARCKGKFPELVLPNTSFDTLDIDIYL